MSFSETFNITTTAPPLPIKYSPTKGTNEVVTKTLDFHLQTKRSRESLKWGTINIILLSVLLFDISNKCPFVFSRWFYVEYCAATILAINVLYYFSKYFYFLFSFEPIKGTEEQKRLLQFSDGDSSFVVTPAAKIKTNQCTTPANVTTLSWHSSMNDSANRTYNRGSPQPSAPQQLGFNSSYGANLSWRSIHSPSSLNNTNNSPNNSAVFSSPYHKYAKDEIITDKRGLQKYLKELSTNETSFSAMVGQTNDSHDRSSMYSLWNYCSNAANLLKTSLYQMAPTTTSVSPKKPATGNDEIGIGGTFSITDIDGHSDEIKRLCATGNLTQYIYNIRTWIACTILHRLAEEINRTNQAFENRGFSDIQIGSISLDRLKKTADNHQLVALYAPILPMVVPFLDISNNQEYLVQRIRDLAKGCVLAEYRWNSGGSYNGQNWDEHLPTDAAIIFHLFCVYMDSQLRPLPQPGGRPFYNRYVLLADKKMPKEILNEFKANNMKCAILFSNTTKPKFNFISDNKIHNCVQDRNNLFYVLIELLVFLKRYNDGLLQGVSLGVSGINLLNTIGE